MVAHMFILSGGLTTVLDGYIILSIQYRYYFQYIFHINTIHTTDTYIDHYTGIIEWYYYRYIYQIRSNKFKAIKLYQI